jgi:hypothetical protein
MEFLGAVVTGALVGAVSCERCGRDFAGQERFCLRCGVLLVPAAQGGILGTYSGMLGGVDRASAGRRNGALAIDSVPVLVFVMAAIVVATSGALTAGVAVILAIVLSLAYLAVELVMLSRHGSSLGRAVLRLRTVDDLTGDPISAGRLLQQLFSARFGRRTVTSDLRTGRDPLGLAQPALASAVLVVDNSEEPADSRAGHASLPYDTSVSADAVAIVLDTGERLQFSGSLLVGRVPENRGDENRPLFAWPDLSRSLSKNHALLEWSGTVLWVTDLHSANGTALRNPEDERLILAPGIRGAATVGWKVELGGRSFEVRPASGDAASVLQSGLSPATVVAAEARVDADAE